MKLISCDACAVILDGDKLTFPLDIWDDEACVDDAKGRYNQQTSTWSTYVTCPVCKADVFQE
jgi:hypothetical protein